jgi:DNA polymerase III epsilon subunit-like protein
MTRLIFLDTESTGLDPDRHETWEVAAIVRDLDNPDHTDDTEYHWFLYVNLDKADLIALNIGRYFERHPTMLDSNQHPVCWNDTSFAREFFLLSIGAHIVGAVPDFDTRFLSKILRRNNLLAAWHYHLVCVENLAAGKLGMEPPWKSDEVFAKLGYNTDTDEYRAGKHTAMGDARVVRDIYDLIMAKSNSRGDNTVQRERNISMGPMD